MKKISFLGTVAVVSALSLGSAMAAGPSAGAAMNGSSAGAVMKSRPNVTTAPTASPGFQPQVDPLGPRPSVAYMVPTSSFQSPTTSFQVPTTSVQTPTTSVRTPTTSVRTPTSSVQTMTPSAAEPHVYRVIPPPPNGAGDNRSTTW